MTAFLPFTGERFTPEARGAIWYEHWHRYCVALPAVAGKRVLDAACGEGYGSWLLAGTASEVLGVDIDHAAIAHAARRYAGRSNLRFVPGAELVEGAVGELGGVAMLVVDAAGVFAARGANDAVTGGPPRTSAFDVVDGARS